MHKIVTHRWRPKRRTTQYVFAGPNAEMRRRRRRELVFVLVLWAVVIGAAWTGHR